MRNGQEQEAAADESDDYDGEDMVAAKHYFYSPTHPHRVANLITAAPPARLLCS